MAIIGAASSVVGLLAFFGITNISQLKHGLSSDSTPTATASFRDDYIPPQPLPSPTYDPQPSPDDVVSSSAPPITFYSPVVPSPSAFDPGTLDNAATDQTPFTEAALLPQGFTDSMGVHFSFVAGGVHPCVRQAMSNDVQYELNIDGCTNVMTGDYLADSGVVTDNDEVLVSVQVFPLASAVMARQTYSSFAPNGSWSFGIWCPTTGRGANACGSGYQSARRQEYIRADHRYLIQAEAVYTNLTQDSVAVPWIQSAALKGDNVSGPENYSGNH